MSLIDRRRSPDVIQIAEEKVRLARLLKARSVAARKRKAKDARDV